MATAASYPAQNQGRRVSARGTPRRRRSSLPRTSPKSTGPSRAPPTSSGTRRSSRTSRPSSTRSRASRCAMLRKSAELGLTAIVIPEQYGGMEMDLASAMIVAERMARDGSYSGWHGAHTGIGTLPLLLFGTEEQKQRYLPKLATAEMMAAYCLSEPQAGSDALAARTRADLTPDGTPLHPQRPEDVDHQRRRGRPVHRLRQGRRREVHRVPGGARFSRRSARRRRKEDGNQGQLHHRRLSRQRQGAGGKRARRDRARPHHRVQHPEPRAPEAGAVLRWAASKDVLAASPEIRQGAQGVRESHRRIRHDPAQAGRDGDPDLRGRVHDLSRGGADRGAACRTSRGTSRTLPRRC